LDETGIIFVTTEDVNLAKKHGIRTFPSLAFFRNKELLMYEGRQIYVLNLFLMNVCYPECEIRKVYGQQWVECLGRCYERVVMLFSYNN
jgi:hypothetical protein